MTSTSPGGNNKQRKRSSNIRRTRSPGGSNIVLQVPQRKRSVSGSSRGSSPGREGSYHSSDQSNGISNVLLQVPQRKRSVSRSSRGSSPVGSPVISRMNSKM